jgi:hypothetical protein
MDSLSGGFVERRADVAWRGRESFDYRNRGVRSVDRAEPYSIISGMLIASFCNTIPQPVICLDFSVSDESYLQTPRALMDGKLSLIYANGGRHTEGEIMA